MLKINITFCHQFAMKFLIKIWLKFDKVFFNLGIKIKHLPQQTTFNGFDIHNINFNWNINYSKDGTSITMTGKSDTIHNAH